MAEEQKKEPPALQHFLSLRSAAALAYTAATGQYTSSTETLNAVARIIAASTPVFVRTDHGPARVLPLELSEGELEGGGEDLRFKDGRAALGGLVILHKNLGEAIDQVRAAFRQSAAGSSSGQR